MPLTLAANSAGIEHAASIVHKGGVVAFPTETLYGLAVDPFNSEALERLLRIKGRDTEACFPLMVADHQMLLGLVKSIGTGARRLMEAFWPGPLTLILPARDGLGHPLVSSKGGIGVRLSADPVATALVRAVGGPVTATSANRSGETPATTAAEALIPGVEAVIDDGPRSSEASTVVEMLGEPVILRQGTIAVKGLL